MKRLLGTMVVLATMLSFAQACTMSWKMEMSHLNYEILMLEEDLERHEFGTEMYDAIYKLIWQKIYRVEGMRMDYGNTVEHYGDGVMCQLRMRNVLGY